MLTVLLRVFSMFYYRYLSFILVILYCNASQASTNLNPVKNMDDPLTVSISAKRKNLDTFESETIRPFKKQKLEPEYFALFDKLPAEIIAYIVHFLPDADVIRLNQTSSKFYFYTETEFKYCSSFMRLGKLPQTFIEPFEIGNFPYQHSYFIRKGMNKLLDLWEINKGNYQTLVPFIKYYHQFFSPMAHLICSLNPHNSRDDVKVSKHQFDITMKEQISQNNPIALELQVKLHLMNWCFMTGYSRKSTQLFKSLESLFWHNYKTTGHALIRQLTLSEKLAALSSKNGLTLWYVPAELEKIILKKMHHFSTSALIKETKTVSKDFLSFIKSMADQQNAFAQYCYGILCEQENDLDQAQTYYRLSAKQGYSKACYWLGVWYEGIEGNNTKAIKYFQRAADQGHCGAQKDLAYLLEIEGQYEKAQIYATLATKQGYFVEDDNVLIGESGNNIDAEESISN